MSIATLLLTVSVATPGWSIFHENPRSAEDNVDPWDVVIDYDPDDSGVAMAADLHIVDKVLRLAQKDIRYFQEDSNLWEKFLEDRGSGEDHIMGFNFTKWNTTYIRPPEGMGDKQTNKLMSGMIPEFDITKIKLKDDEKDNGTVIFRVEMKEGLENKIIGYTSKRLHIQIHAPNLKGAADNELARYLSKILAVSRKSIKIKQKGDSTIREVHIPKAAVQEKLYVRKLIKELGLEEVTKTPFDA